MRYSDGGSECNLPVKLSSQCGLAVREHLTAFSFYVCWYGWQTASFSYSLDSHSIQDISSQRGREELKEGKDIKVIMVLLWDLFSPK